MKQLNPALSSLSRLYASLGLISVLGLGTLSAQVAHAAVVYLPSCNVCTLDATPPAGDEWVIQGNFVSVGVDGLLSAGALTNNAKVFSNTYGFTTNATLTNNKSLVNAGSLHVAGLSVDVSLVNIGTLTNSGTVQVDANLDNRAGAKLVNTGSFAAAWGPFTNSGTVTNFADFSISFTKLTNKAGATFDNRGTLLAISDASIDNLGTFRNRSGATLKTSGFLNSGTLINDAGGTIEAGYGFRSASGSTLINHGTITTIDSVFELSAGSNYDFTGGTLINSHAQGHIVFSRDFTFGEAKGGTVQLEYGGTVRNNARLKVAAGYTQLNGGDLYNYNQLDNNGTLNSVGLHNLSKLNNVGKIDVLEVMTNRAGASFNNTGTLSVSTGQAYNDGGATLTNKGTLSIGPSGQFVNSGTVASSGKILVSGSFTNNGIVNGAGSLQQDAGQVVIAGSTTVNSLKVLGGQTSLQAGGVVTAANILVGSAGTVSHTDGVVVNVSNKLTNSGTYNVSGLGGRINGNVLNQGEWSVQGSQMVFAGKFTNQGHFASDASSSTFRDLVVMDSGWMTAGASDSFTVQGNFLNGSQMGSSWHTSDARLVLAGQGTQRLGLAGADFGTSRNGYFNNYAWGEISLGGSAQFLLVDGNASAGGALYTGLFTLQGGLTQLGSITSAYNIYYDPSLAGNAYLGGLTYAFGHGGGHLIAVDAPLLGGVQGGLAMPAGVTSVPEPSVVGLAFSGLMVAMWGRRRVLKSKRA